MHHHRYLLHVRRRYGRRAAAVELVGAVDGVRVPVTPVQPVLEDGDGEGVSQDLRGGEDNAESRTYRQSSFDAPIDRWSVVVGAFSPTPPLDPRCNVSALMPSGDKWAGIKTELLPRLTRKLITYLPRLSPCAARLSP